MPAFRIEFDWDPSKVASNRTKHGVGFELAMTVFRDAFAATILDSEHGADEERWITLGESANGALVLVVHTWVRTSDETARVRITSARRPIKREARQCREGQL
ncbi:MAG: BrnT family toxin [Roseiarcus sp.]|jgi:uncharacterized DUF497 family protein